MLNQRAESNTLTPGLYEEGSRKLTNNILNKIVPEAHNNGSLEAVSQSTPQFTLQKIRVSANKDGKKKKKGKSMFQKEQFNSLHFVTSTSQSVSNDIKGRGPECSGSA